MGSKPDIKVIFDNTKKVLEALRAFTKDGVLIGIPEEKGPREDNSPINNAGLLALCNFGSPLQNIPPWPVMAIGIERAQPAIVKAFKEGAQKALSGGANALSNAYNKAGIAGSVAVKLVLNEQAEVPDDKPSPSTLAARKSRGFKGDKYWIVSGQMRNAITYVVKGES